MIVQHYLMHYRGRGRTQTNLSLPKKLDIKHVFPDKSNCQIAAHHSVLEEVRLPALSNGNQLDAKGSFESSISLSKAIVSWLEKPAFNLIV